MFDKNFYPTPEHLIKKMLKPFEKKIHRGGINGYYVDGYGKLDGKIILDPSAGKGNILDFIKNKCSYKTELNAIELNVELREILKSKGYPIINDDFLEYNENVYWDLIIMNPPFDKGDEHLLKAISIATNTDIVCILNAETIKNPYTQKRKMLKNMLEYYNASIEFVQNAFSTAERKTDVEIAIVSFKVEQEVNDFDFDFETEKFPELNFDFDLESNALARKDLIGNMQVQNEIVTNLYKKKLEADERFFYFLKRMTDTESYYSDDNYLLKDGSSKQKYNHLTKNLKKFMWKQVIDELDVKKYMSFKVSKNFDAFVNQQKDMAFTKENVAKFFQMIMNNRKNIWEQAIVDVFDVFTRYSHENRMNVPAWRTNDRYKINRKVILPDFVEWETDYMSGERLKTVGTKFKVKWNRNHQYEDIDKVLAYINGDSLTSWNCIASSLEAHFKFLGNVRKSEKFDNNLESKYFKIKFFKAGTVHLTFKDKKLWEEFNMRACAGKNWLPGPEKRQWEEEKAKKRDNRKKSKKENYKQIELF